MKLTDSKFYFKKLPEYLVILLPFLLLTSNAAADIAISSIALLFVVNCVVDRKLDSSFIGHSFAILFGFIIIHSIFLGDILKAIAYSRFGVFAISVIYLANANPKLPDKIVQSLAIALSIFIAGGYFEYFVGYDFFGEKPPLDRLTSFHSKPIAGILCAWLFLPVTAWLYDKNTSLSALFTLAAIILIVLSGERVALLIAALGLMFFAATNFRCVGVFITLAILALGAATIYNNDALYERVVNKSIAELGDYQNSHYGKIIENTAKISADNPIVGVGLKQYRNICDDYPPAGHDCSYFSHPHNIYLEWLVEFGIIGLTVFVIFLLKNINLRDTIRNDSVFTAITIALTLRLLPFITSTSFFSNWGAACFWFVLALYLSYKKQQN